MSTIQGLQYGLVVNNIDLSGDFRIQVTIPAIGPDRPWARLVNTGSGINPKIGDEVLVGFINNNVQQPVILGLIYNQQTPPPVTPPKTKKTGS